MGKHPAIFAVFTSETITKWNLLAPKRDSVMEPSTYCLANYPEESIEEYVYS